MGVMFFLRTSKSALKPPVLSTEIGLNRIITLLVTTLWTLPGNRVHVIQKFINIAFIFPSFIRIQKPVTDNIAELLRKFKHRENKLSEIET